MQWEGGRPRKQNIETFLSDISGFPQDVIRTVSEMTDTENPEKMHPQQALKDGLMIYIRLSNQKERLSALSNLLAKLSFVAETALYMSAYQVLNYLYQKRIVPLSCTEIWETMDEIDVIVLHSFPVMDERDEILKIDSLTAVRGAPKRKDITIIISDGSPARLIQTEEAYGYSRVKVIGDDHR